MEVFFLTSAFPCYLHELPQYIIEQQVDRQPTPRWCPSAHAHLVLKDIPMNISNDSLNLTNVYLVVQSFVNEWSIPFTQRMQDHWLYTLNVQYGVSGSLFFLLIVIFLFLVILCCCAHMRLGKYIYDAFSKKNELLKCYTLLYAKVRTMYISVKCYTLLYG